MTICTRQRASQAIFMVLIAGLSMIKVYAAQEDTPLNSSSHQSSALREEQWALKQRAQLIADLCSAPDPQSLHSLAMHGDEDTAIRLLRTDSGWAQLNQKKARDAQKTPLRYAVANGHTNMVHLLLTCGADVDATSQSGLTPLHFSAYQMYVDETLLLLKHNANVNATDLQGDTPLHWLTTSRKIGFDRTHSFLSFTAVAQLLLNYGANITARNRYGQTPLDCASSNRWKAKLEQLNRERMQTLKALAEKLQERLLSADVVRHLLAFALTEEQREQLMHLDQEKE